MNVRIAVHLHVYYIDQLDFLKFKLSSLNNYNYDLFVTVRPNAEAIRKIKKCFPEATIIISPNFGFDIYPFILFCKQINLSEYQVVFKIHSKQRVPNDVYINGYNLGRYVWRNLLFDSLLGTKRRVDKIVKMLLSNEKVGAIGARKLYQDKNQLYDHIKRERVLLSLKNTGLSLAKEEAIVGSFMACRAKLLLPFRDMDISPESCYLNYPRTWNEFPYVLERLLGFSISAQGYSIKTLRPTHMFIFRHLFWYWSSFWEKCERMIPLLNKIRRAIKSYDL